MFSSICEGQWDTVDVQVVDCLHVVSVAVERGRTEDLEFGLFRRHFHLFCSRPWSAVEDDQVGGYLRRAEQNHLPDLHKR